MENMSKKILYVFGGEFMYIVRRAITLSRFTRSMRFSSSDV